MNGYQVLMRPAAQRDLDRLSGNLCERVLRAIVHLAVEPRPHGVKKLVGSRSEWRLRVSDYRVLYEIDDKGRIVTIFRGRHRREAYR